MQLKSVEVVREDSFGNVLLSVDGDETWMTKQEMLAVAQVMADGICKIISHMRIRDICRMHASDLTGSLYATRMRIERGDDE